jgi:hypothetical protein
MSETSPAPDVAGSAGTSIDVTEQVTTSRLPGDAR